MKIGLVLEGSYPYVSGGVSSWTQMLIENLVDYEFELIVIVPDEDYARKPYKYTLPKNVTGITVLPLSQMKDEKVSRKPIDFTEQDEQMMLDWLLFKHQDADALALIHTKIHSVEGYFRSPFFYKAAQKGYQQDSIQGSFNHYLWMWRSMYQPVLQMITQKKPDVDVIHAVSTGFAGLVAASMSHAQKIPFILTEHGIYTREREEEILQSDWILPEYKERWIEFFRMLSIHSYNQSDRIVSLFQRNQELQIEQGADPTKCELIPNGVNYHQLAALPRIKQPIFTIGSLVRIVPIKDIKTMIQAALLLKNRGREFFWYILGNIEEDAQYAEECMDLVRQNDLEETILFPGNVKVEEYLPLFDLGVLSSISEGQPLSILEGMAAQIPFIASDVGACKELIFGRDDEKFAPAGVVVPPVDAVALAEQIEWMMDHPEERAQFGRNGQQRVETSYQTFQFLSKYEQLYQRLERGVWQA